MLDCDSYSYTAPYSYSFLFSIVRHRTTAQASSGCLSCSACQQWYTLKPQEWASTLRLRCLTVFTKSCTYIMVLWLIFIWLWVTPCCTDVLMWKTVDADHTSTEPVPQRTKNQKLVTWLLFPLFSFTDSTLNPEEEQMRLDQKSEDVVSTVDAHTACSCEQQSCSVWCSTSQHSGISALQR